jgi:excinuclease ABC subunit C
MVMQVVGNIQFIVTDTEAEALALEAKIIKQHQPQFNVLLRDDKKYPFLCVTWSEDYPRLFITRKRRENSSQSLLRSRRGCGGCWRRTLNLVKRTFPLRQRPQPTFKGPGPA